MHEHARTSFVGSLDQPRRSARELGYRMPGEFEPIDCVWVTRPHDPESWPGCLEEAQQQFKQMLDQLRRFVAVTSTQEMEIETDDSWIRDYGPIFVVKDEQRATGSATPVPSQRPRVACHDFIYNCWGEKYAPYEHDDVVPQHIALAGHMPVWIHNMVLEGGAIDVNGTGTVMCTEQCLLNVNRNPHLSRAQIEVALHDALGTAHTLWLPGGISGDDTDGHIDQVARFIRPDTVVAVRANRNHPDYETLQLNWRVLEHARDERGRRLHLVELPMPESLYYDYPEDGEYHRGRQRLPASYANFLIANSGVLVPTFGQATDDHAVAILQRAMPDHRVVPVRCEHLIVGLGAIHCLSMPQPA